jgi:hypothetical protein
VTQTRQRFAYDSLSWLDYTADESPDGSSVLHKFDYTFKTNTPFVESDLNRTSQPRQWPCHEKQTLAQVGFPSPANGFPTWDVRFAKGGLDYEPFTRKESSSTSH